MDRPHSEEIQRRVDQVLFSQTPAGIEQKATIEQRYCQGEFDFEEAARQMADAGLTGRATYKDELSLEYLANHYYLPVMYSTQERLEYIQHIIDTPSQLRFLNKLKEYVKKPESLLRLLDWWMFSKINQYLDTPFIPCKSGSFTSPRIAIRPRKGASSDYGWTMWRHFSAWHFSMGLTPSHIDGQYLR